jgi:hypothetical protein
LPAVRPTLPNLHPLLFPPNASPSSLHKVQDDDGKKFELEVSWICDESNKQHQRVGRGSREALGDSRRDSVRVVRGACVYASLRSDAASLRRRRYCPLLLKCRDLSCPVLYFRSPSITVFPALHLLSLTAPRCLLRRCHPSC